MNSAENIMCSQYYGKFKVNGKLASVSDCCGCAVCRVICPVDAIVMKKNEKNGFLYPDIDAKKCIDCGKCSQVCCEVHNTEESDYYSRVFAAINKDDSARMRSASGAMFEALARSVLLREGAVCGVAYTQNLRYAKHILIEDVSQLPQLCGTKYFQSDNADCYQEIEKIINEKNKTVLFCGTPCQVKAMNVFAKESGLADKLYTIDLLCRGIPSQLVWEKYLEYLEKREHKQIRAIKVKEKENGWDKIGVMISFTDGSRRYEKLYESVFLRSFLQENLAVRESCFHCSYKSIQREGDLSIGDFWGLKNTALLERNMGTSLVLVNSKKGMELFQQSKDSMEYKASTMWRVWCGNTAAFHQVDDKVEKRDLFWTLLAEGKDLEETVNAVSEKESER